MAYRDRARRLIIAPGAVWPATRRERSRASAIGRAFENSLRVLSTPEVWQLSSLPRLMLPVVRSVCAAAYASFRIASSRPPASWPRSVAGRKIAFECWRSLSEARGSWRALVDGERLAQPLKALVTRQPVEDRPHAEKSHEMGALAAGDAQSIQGLVDLTESGSERSRGESSEIAAGETSPAARRAPSGPRSGAPPRR